MIKHSVVFKLKHPIGSAEEKIFFDALNKLTAIACVQNFVCYRQTSKHNLFDFGLFMDFADEKFYEEYNGHPLHVAFVEQYWASNVESFLELDYQPL